VPNVCPGVTCPDMGEPACGPKPTVCGEGWNLKCIVDRCACKWRWFSADIRAPSASCSAALQQCTPQDQCPKEFECDAPESDPLIASLDPKVLSQLECSQDQCTCRPIYTAPSTGVRTVCEPDSPGCCEDGLLPSPQCSAAEAQQACTRVVCEGVEADSCVADGCQSCGLTIWDADANQIDSTKCKVNVIDELADACGGVVCPDEVIQNANCPPRPSCYPDDWKLECILNPCTCRTMWVSEDVRRVPATCSATIVPEPVDSKDCPKEFSCLQASADTEARVPDEVEDAMICVQEPGSCRPVQALPEWLPPGFRLPCKESECCEDGEGPLVCPRQNAETACEFVLCDGIKPATCASDGCDQCNIVYLNEKNQPYDLAKCAVPFDSSAYCPGVSCENIEPTEDCPSRPDTCPGDWKLKCVQDPCSCFRKIWVDEDVRLSSTECSSAIVPACVAPDDCPKNFECENLPFGGRCIQEPCTCRPVVIPGEPGDLQT